MSATRRSARSHPEKTNNRKSRGLRAPLTEDQRAARPRHLLLPPGRDARPRSGLNLLVAAVIMWNTQYLQLAAAELGVWPEMMGHVAPLGWEHLSLTGDYAWDAEGQLTPGELRPLRTRASLLAA